MRLPGSVENTTTTTPTYNTVLEVLEAYFVHWITSPLSLESSQRFPLHTSIVLPICRYKEARVPRSAVVKAPEKVVRGQLRSTD